MTDSNLAVGSSVAMAGLLHQFHKHLVFVLFLSMSLSDGLRQLSRAQVGRVERWQEARIIPWFPGDTVPRVLVPAPLQYGVL